MPLPRRKTYSRTTASAAPTTPISVSDLVGAPPAPASAPALAPTSVPATETPVVVPDPVNVVNTPVSEPQPVTPIIATPIVATPIMATPIMATPIMATQPYTRVDMRNNGYSSYNNSMMSDANTPTQPVSGTLDVQAEGHGFLRPKFTPSDKDIYISQSQIRKFMLRPGDMVKGQAREPKDNERYYGLLKVESVNEVSADKLTKRPDFNNLTPIYPREMIKLETKKIPLSTRIIDLAAPIGKGQRGMIVSPPKAGKTTILKELAASISENYPDIHLMAVLIGERPEEVTDISRSVKGEVIASNFDEPAENQTRAAEVALERARRLVESGKDVFVLLDSITRLARAYNLSIPTSGRTLSGGFDPAALYPPKRFFGAARCFEEGGSMTIIGTALVDTGSRMDDLIYEEFKGTGNMELHLDRGFAEKRIFPAINISKSGTRHEELLLNEETLRKVVTMRRMLEMLSEEERTEVLIERLSKTNSNEQFLESLGKG